MFVFGTQVGVNDIGGGGGNASDVTMTRISGTGPVAVGEQVTFSGLTSIVPAASGISNGDTATYQGSGVFNGEIGYVFTAGPTLVIPGTLLVLFDGKVVSQALINAASAYSLGNAAQTLSPVPACFAEKTLIATPSGEVAVEALAIGDPVLTADGHAVPVRWIGRQTMLKLFAGERAQLVRIGQGALGNHSDLYVTGDHGMVVDGNIVNASALIDGRWIDWVPWRLTPDRQTVYHVETEAHDILFANGALTESYIDMPGRRAFDNFAEYLDLYGAERPIAPNPLPRISSARLLPPATQKRLGSTDRLVSQQWA